MAVHILGIRHHGVGSAEMVRTYLEDVNPDIILVEGPPEITDQLQLIGHQDLKPPVALIVYDQANLQRTSFYPFASYSPEWVACKHAASVKIPIKAIDLPAAITFAQANTREAESKKETNTNNNESNTTESIVRRDPLSYLADIAGYPSGESWWDEQFELVKNREAKDHFDGVNLVMTTLREEGIASSLDEENIYREAYMRQSIRATINELYANIVVICGAWHGPKLTNLKVTEKEDNKLLKSLPKSKIKVDCSWIPWTNGRLSRFSGYGAGISAPGWYEHLWTVHNDQEINWLSKVASLFRSEDVDISTAHVLESYRLSHSLAALRDHAVISFDDLHDAIRTVMCNGDDILYELIKTNLLVNEKIGSLPADIPKVPLQQDFELHLKSLRLKLSAMPKLYNLDLRKPLDLKRSILFHRLNILGITWAESKSVRKKGSFKEGWELTWDPQMQILLIDKSNYGNTIEYATQGLINHTLQSETQISEFVKLIDLCIPAQLFRAMDNILEKINELASISRDTKDLIRSLPPLINISRYGDVRKTDIEQIDQIISRLFNKICVSLANTCYGLDEENSNEIFNLIVDLDRAMKLIDTEGSNHKWINTLEEIVKKEGVHAVIKGCTIRLLFDRKRIDDDELSVLLSYYLSASNKAVDVAFWIEGFLRGSGLILIYDDRIWNPIYQRVSSVPSDIFIELLPVLRRAFSKFSFGERRQIGEKAKQGLTLIATTTPNHTPATLDHDRGLTILPFIQKYLIGKDVK